MNGHRIRWFAVAEGQRFPRRSSMRGAWGWDATCSCGWDSRTGGALRRCVAEKVADHKAEILSAANQKGA